MNTLRHLVLFVVLLAMTGAAYSQELNCKVNVNTQALSTEERIVWDGFATDVEAYLNTYAWTTNFSGQKIQCTMTFNIKGSNGSSYNVQLFVQSVRPIAGTTQLATMARFLDDNVTFDYTRGMALQHSGNYRDLESVLDYYAQIIIGLDQDSYTPELGSVAFQHAQEAALVANAASGAGWDRLVTSSGAFSRVGYVEDLASPGTRVIRDLWQSYHVNVLDRMMSDEDGARNAYAGIIDTLIEIKRSSSDLDRSVFFKTMFNSKYTELADFGRWFKDNADVYFRKLKYLDPGHANFYEDAYSKLN
ncbi:MAG: DUF4835 family protein [Bacteroidetes bacterium]|nr:DUF4835 family protein [Bacteroidota bacterium]